MSDESPLWVEKYRPHNLSEITNQKEIVDRLKMFVKEKNIPHLLFAGPPGTGKTTAILALANDLYGGKTEGNILDMNASDERGINVVRTRIKDFARTIPISDVPFKIIILDEADAVTSDAHIAQRLRFIAEKESIKLEDSGLKAILYIANGDLRRAINTLQGASAVGASVSDEVVYKVASRARPEEVLNMLELALSGKFLDARNMLHSLLINYGLSGIDVIKQIHREILRLKISDSEKIKLTDCVGEIDFRLTQGANEEIQLSALLAHFAGAGVKMTR